LSILLMTGSPTFGKFPPYTSPLY